MPRDLCGAAQTTSEALVDASSTCRCYWIGLNCKLGLFSQREESSRQFGFRMESCRELIEARHLWAHYQ